MIAIDVAPPNSLLLIMDPSVGEIPESMSGALVAANATCIAIGTLSAQDGSTQVFVGRLDEDEGTGTQCQIVFDGVLATPQKRIVVASVMEDIFFETQVSGTHTRVRIRANDSSEPNEIRIVLATVDVVESGGFASLLSDPGGQR